LQLLVLHLTLPQSVSLIYDLIAQRLGRDGNGHGVLIVARDVGDRICDRGRLVGGNGHYSCRNVRGYLTYAYVFWRNDQDFDFDFSLGETADDRYDDAVILCRDLDPVALYRDLSCPFFDPVVLPSVVSI
jgi:hypothetical protein